MAISVLICVLMLAISVLKGKTYDFSKGHIYFSFKMQIIASWGIWLKTSKTKLKAKSSLPFPIWS